MSDDIVRIIGILMALVLVVANLRGHKIGLSDGVRMVALWGFLFIAMALVFTVIGW